MNNENVNKYLNAVSKVVESLDRQEIVKFSEAILETYNLGGTVFVFGNGGSAASASHFAGDLVFGTSRGLDKRFKAICLSDNSTAMMAAANDICYDDIFVEQLKNFLSPGDLAVGISGSGNSDNVLRAIEFAKSQGVTTAGICGYDGGKLKSVVDISVHANINDMEISEDVHLVIFHCTKRTLMETLHNASLQN